MEKVINRIRHVMDLRKISAAEISRRSGIDRSSLSHYLNGDYYPKTEKIEKIADALNVPASYLFGFTDDMEFSSDPELNELMDKLIRMTQPGSFGPVTISRDDYDLVVAYHNADPLIQSAVRKLLDLPEVTE